MTRLTQEQQAIIRSTGDIKINAVAGSGKTTTLIAYARARPSEKILYLAFNKTVKLDAARKFAEMGLSNVRVETAHSLAYSYIVRAGKYTVRPDSYKTSEIAQLLDLNALSGKHSQYIFATHILALTAWFCNSDRATLNDMNYEDVVTDPAAQTFVIRYKKEIVDYTRLFLNKMNQGEIDITHDFYLKKFHLARPVLPYDSILFDEGQDASEAMLAVFLAQKATKVIVGDTHQQIYSWRYAINSLEKVGFPGYDLSASFRFDPSIARIAKDVVGWKNHLALPAHINITGHGQPGKIKTKAVIARTNAGLLVRAIEMLIEQKKIGKVYFEGRIDSYTFGGEGASIYDVLNLHLGERTRIRDKIIASMADMEELEEYIDSTGDAQLRSLVPFVKEYGLRIPGYIQKLKECHVKEEDKSKADRIFSTVHRCKGLEYDEVTLVDDFITEARLVELGNPADKTLRARLTEEINLLYVAVTRTRSKLTMPEEGRPGTARTATKKASTLKEKNPAKIIKKGHGYSSAGTSRKILYKRGR